MLDEGSVATIVDFYSTSHYHISISYSYVKIRRLFVNQLLENGEMKIKHCPTESMVADILTEPIVGSHFKVLAKQLLGYEKSFS